MARPRSITASQGTIAGHPHRTRYESSYWTDARRLHSLWVLRLAPRMGWRLAVAMSGRGGLQPPIRSIALSASKSSPPGEGRNQAEH